MLRHPVFEPCADEGPRYGRPLRGVPAPVVVGNGPGWSRQAGVGCPEARDRLLPAPGLLCVRSRRIERGRRDASRRRGSGCREDGPHRMSPIVRNGATSSQVLNVAGEVPGPTKRRSRSSLALRHPAQSREQGSSSDFGALGEDGRASPASPSLQRLRRGVGMGHRIVVVIDRPGCAHRRCCLPRRGSGLGGPQLPRGYGVHGAGWSSRGWTICQAVRRRPAGARAGRQLPSMAWRGGVHTPRGVPEDPLEVHVEVHGMADEASPGCLAWRLTVTPSWRRGGRPAGWGGAW